MMLENDAVNDLDDFPTISEMLEDFADGGSISDLEMARRSEEIESSFGYEDEEIQESWGTPVVERKFEYDANQMSVHSRDQSVSDRTDEEYSELLRSLHELTARVGELTQISKQIHSDVHKREPSFHKRNPSNGRNAGLMASPKHGRNDSNMSMHGRNVSHTSMHVNTSMHGRNASNTSLHGRNGSHTSSVNAVKPYSPKRPKINTSIVSFVSSVSSSSPDSKIPRTPPAVPRKPLGLVSEYNGGALDSEGHRKMLQLQDKVNRTLQRQQSQKYNPLVPTKEETRALEQMPKKISLEPQSPPAPGRSKRRLVRSLDDNRTLDIDALLGPVSLDLPPHLRSDLRVRPPTKRSQSPPRKPHSFPNAYSKLIE